MAKELKLSDLYAMLSTSDGIATEFQEEDDPVTVQVLDEEDNLYYIQDVKYNVAAKCITIIFDHDDD